MHMHGHTAGGRQHPLYSTWRGMRERCLNPNYPDYAYYGGRGITICGRWDDFSAFIVDMGPRPDGHTLDQGWV